MTSIAPGCGPGPGLVIATTWPEAEQKAMASELARRGGDPVPIGWVRLAPGRGAGEVIGHGIPADLVLGGPVSTYRELARQGRLEPPDSSARPSWSVIRRPRPARPEGSRLPFVDADPRDDPGVLAAVEARLAAGTKWSECYADLVRRAASGPLDSMGPGSWPEGAGIVPGARHPDAARAFLQVFGERGSSESNDPPGGPMAESLLADLLGATLVDARPELRAADAALAREGRPSRWESWMLQPPPWPPASISRIIAKHRAEGNDPAPWVETLARQIAPEPDARAWLLVSWGRPERPVDPAILAELVGVAGGSLARESSFRAWLREEWREWARQRFRRVARGSTGALP